MLDGIWGIGIWLGGFLLFFLALVVLMKVFNLVNMLKEKHQNDERWIFLLLQYFPYFIILLPILFLFYNIFTRAGGIDDWAISTMAYEQLIVEQAPMVAGFVLAWTILQIVVVLGYEKMEME